MSTPNETLRAVVKRVEARAAGRQAPTRAQRLAEFKVIAPQKTAREVAA